MELKFTLVNEKEINIYAVENKKNIDGKRKRLVGTIFTPSGSGHDIKNAIQVCGFSEAFDYWGCAVFGKFEDKQSVVARLEGRIPEHVQRRDIQLKFDWETEPHKETNRMGDDCLGCYNKPCTCDRDKLVLTENEVIDGKSKKYKNPYDVKRGEDIPDLEEVKEK